MANYNARDFLRDSIAGDVANGINQPKNNAKNNDGDNDIEIHSILFPSQNQSINDFIISTEQNLGFDFYKNYQSNDEKTNFLHSSQLFNEAIISIENNNYEKASDIFSLIIALSSNYFYSYLFALVRHSLYDDSGTLELLNIVQKQIKEQSDLPQELIEIIKTVNFSEHYYVFYMTSLVDASQTTEVEQFLNFVLDHHLLKDVSLSLKLIYSFSYNKAKIKELVQEAISLISKVSDSNLKNSFTEKLKIIIRGVN